MADAEDVIDDDALVNRLDPDCVPALLRLPAVDLADDPLAIRAAVHDVFDELELPGPPPGVQVDVVPAEGSLPELRVYLPEVRRHDVAGLMWVHGGGLIAGGARYDDFACGRMALDHGVPVVSVDYRLAPEFPYPAALDDCFAATQWVMAARELGVAPGRLVVTGGSAGGGLAIALAMLARDRGLEAIGGLVCAYPMLDDRPGSPSMERLTARRTWHRGVNQVAWRSYLGDLTDVPLLAAPGRAETEQLRGLPPVHLDVGTLDGFLDETVSFALRLAEADVPVELMVTPHASHGSEHLNASAPTSRRILQARYDARERALRCCRDA